MQYWFLGIADVRKDVSGSDLASKPRSRTDRGYCSELVSAAINIISFDEDIGREIKLKRVVQYLQQKHEAIDIHRLRWEDPPDFSDEDFERGSSDFEEPVKRNVMKKGKKKKHVRKNGKNMQRHAKKSNNKQGKKGGKIKQNKLFIVILFTPTALLE